MEKMKILLLIERLHKRSEPSSNCSISAACPHTARSRSSPFLFHRISPSFLPELVSKCPCIGCKNCQKWDIASGSPTLRRHGSRRTENRQRTLSEASWKCKWVRTQRHKFRRGNIIFCFSVSQNAYFCQSWERVQVIDFCFRICSNTHSGGNNQMKNWRLKLRKWLKVRPETPKELRNKFSIPWDWARLSKRNNTSPLRSPTPDPRQAAWYLSTSQTPTKARSAPSRRAHKA